LSPMTPLTWLTIFYQAACRQRHVHSVESHQEDSVTRSDSCMLRLDSGNADEEDDVENVAESSASVEKRSTTCGCSNCFLHVPQYSQQAYLQIVRVSFQFSCTSHTTQPQPFYSPFSGTTQVSRCQMRTSGLYCARED